jgi:hypothetical protein
MSTLKSLVFTDVSSPKYANNVGFDPSPSHLMATELPTPTDDLPLLSSPTRLVRMKAQDETTRLDGLAAPPKIANKWTVWGCEQLHTVQPPRYCLVFSCVLSDFGWFDHVF